MHSPPASNISHSSLPLAGDLNNDTTHPEDKHSDALAIHIGNKHRVNLLALVPTLIAFWLSAGAATSLIVWLLSRRISDHPTNEDVFFRMAIVALEGSGGPQVGLDGSRASKTTLYGLVISSAAVRLCVLIPCLLTNIPSTVSRAISFLYPSHFSWALLPMLSQLTGSAISPYRTNIFNYRHQPSMVCS